MPQIQSAIERRLSTHGGQNGIRLFFGNDLLNGLPSDGLNVGHICSGRVGHDGGWVAVDQDDLVALLSQSLAGLYTGVIKLTRLSNNDGASPNDQNTFEVLSFRHG